MTATGASSNANRPTIANRRATASDTSHNLPITLGDRPITAIAVTPDRFAQGMTFDEYVAFMATPANLAREGTGGAARIDRGGFFRQAFERARLNPDQKAAFDWLLAQPNPPAKMLAISEEWSS